MIYRSKILINAFRQFLDQISRDAMLVMLCFAPVLSGLFFRFGIPYIQSLLVKYLDMPELFRPYYLLCDLMLGSLTPVLFCFAAAYVILGEIDDGISKYYAITPVGKNGYLLSRVGIPSIMAFLVSIVTLKIFNLSSLFMFDIIVISFISSIQGIIVALLVVSLSTNKVEGMAVSKLSGLFILGIPVPFFITGNIQFILFFLPSFWLAKYEVEKNYLFIFVSILISFGWIVILHRKFIKKIR